MKKRTLALLLVLVMLVGVFAGCRKKTVIESYYDPDDSIAVNGGDNDGDNTGNNGESGNDKTESNASGNGNQNNNNAGGNGGGDSIIQVDKNTGVSYLDDELDDWEKMYRRGKDLTFTTAYPAMFLGDESRVIRYMPYKDCWMTYKFDAGIEEVGIVVFEYNDWSSMEAYVSKDNKNWTKLNKPKPYEVTVTDDEWVQRTYKWTGINKENKYLKIDLLEYVNENDSKGKQKNVYAPNLSRVRINNLATMDDPDRYLEGRKSATFYVDSKKGSDNNDGTSPEKAMKSLNRVSKRYFQAGDKILFKSGQTFNGYLRFRGQGTAKNPIYIGTYGGKAKAKISSRSEIAVSLRTQNITVENLEITNPNGIKGISIIPFTTGANKNITIKNCYIHDIDIKQTHFDDRYNASGLSASADGAEPTWFDGLTIENNVFENISRVAIIIGSEWAKRPGTYGHEAGYNIEKDSPRWANKNVVIRGNTITRPHGDSIMALCCDGALVEKNTSVQGFWNPKKIANVASAGIWTWGSNDNVLQYNDVSFHQFPAGCSDGEAFDIDISDKRAILQYNYSHDNEGGFLLMCNDYNPNPNVVGADRINRDSVVRFNLSVNDGNTKKYVWALDDANPGTMIYNNTTYISSKNVTAVIGHWQAPSKDWTFVNNIFVGGPNTKFDWSGMANIGSEWRKYGATLAWPNSKFNNNIMYNVNYENLIKVGSGLSFNGNITDKDPKFKNQNLDTKKATRAQAIDAFTPTNKIRGAVNVPNNGGKDIAGNKFTNIDFFGCVKY